MKKFNSLRLDLAEKTLTPAEKKKREEIAMAMERENPGMPMGKKMAIATATAKRVAEENLDEISTKLLAKAASAASDPDSDYSYGKSHDPQKFADHAKKTKDAKSAAAVQGAADAKGHYVRPGHTLGSYDKLAHRTPARVTSTGKANKQDVKTLKGSIKRNEEVESIDELKSSTLDSYITKVATGPSRGNTQTGIPKSIKAIGGVTTALRKKAENNNPPFEPDAPKKNPSAVAGKYGIGPSIAAHLAKKGMKNVLNNVDEEIKTTHEDPLVVVKDAEGNILTHANRSVAGKIHGITVSPHTIHTGMPVEVVDRDGKKLTVQKSMHHDSEVAKDNASAVKEEADKKYTHALIHSKTGNVLGKYTSLKAASRAGDKKDLAYGAVAHHVKYIGEAKEKSEYDYEGDMARGQLQSIIMNAQRVHDMIKDNDNLPEWVQSKITLAEDYISTVSNYMASEIDEETSSHTFEPATHKPTVKTSKGHSFEGNTYNAKGLKGASIYKHKDTGKYYANKIDANTTFHSSAKEAAEKYHTKAK
jgi:hypothetical protein